MFQALTLCRSKGLTFLLPYSGITHSINLFDYPNLLFMTELTNKLLHVILHEGGFGE